MRKSIFLIFFLILGSSLALACQYKVTQPYTKEVIVSYDNGTELNYALLEIKDFRQGGIDNRWPENNVNAQFKVYNNYDEQINVSITYAMDGVVQTRVRLIDSLGYTQITDGPGNNINNNTIQFIIHNPSGLEIKKVTKTFSEEICKKCPAGSGTECIDDGQPAGSDVQCGSGRRNLNGMCICSDCPRYIVGDNKSSTELGENCKNSPIDSACGANTKCDEIGVCAVDCANPPAGKECCNGEFREAKVKEENLPCSCSFECKSNTCYKGKCLNMFEPKLTCKTGTTAKIGEELSCNLVAKNVNMNRDVKVTFTLDAGDGLAFTESNGCQNIKGSQCIGTYTIADLSNEAVEVGIQALAGGDSKISGEVSFPYEGSTTAIAVPVLIIHVAYCGDRSVDAGETQKTCCEDTSCPENTLIFEYYGCNADGNHQCSRRIKPMTLVIGVCVLIFCFIVAYFMRDSRKGRSSSGGVYRTGRSWPKDEIHRLKKEFLRGVSLKEMSMLHKRDEEAIVCRLIKLGLLGFEEPAAQPKNHGKTWTRSEDSELKEGYGKNDPIIKLAEKFERDPNSVLFRLITLGAVKPHKVMKIRRK